MMAASSGDKGGYEKEATQKDLEVALALVEDEESEESVFDDDEELTAFKEEVLLLKDAGDVDALKGLVLKKRSERKALAEDIKYVMEAIKGINISSTGVFNVVIVFRGVNYTVEVDGTTTFRTLREAWLAQHKKALMVLGFNRSNIIVMCNLIFTCNGHNLKTHARQSFTVWGFGKGSVIKVNGKPETKSMKKDVNKKEEKKKDNKKKDDKKEKK